VFKEDPTVNIFEERVANMFNKEAALFFPSGTMTNQTAINIQTEPGDQLICDHYAHVYNYEGGGVSFNSGVSCRLIEGDRGKINADQVAAMVNPPDFYHSPKTTLVCLENTTNKGGGACYDFSTLKAIRKTCDEYKLSLHLDGARLWNAMLETKAKPEDYGNLFDTISLCFSKGLGCPVGSVLVGSKTAMEKALRIRKIFGGGMRQSGYLAAAGLYALDNNLESLKEDHRKAKEIETVLKNCSYVASVEPVETNIIIFSLTHEHDEIAFMEWMKNKNILLIALGKGKLRLVTHRDYTESHHQYFLENINHYNE
ncbi:aminotransferase class I/II-fold pyridoxal phosphate-dependent enzyme, partial [Flavobacteriaceae bacterium]|nr:aminotransferase class I/II-fold pyridoxal phosphate-dependent enzyme [Flavobacteriaceae bacterium]